MNTRFVEVTNGPRNWGKFMVGWFDDDEWRRPSRIPDTLGVHSLLGQRGWSHAHFLVLDLETGEGAMFSVGSHKADLDKHKIWVCPMYEPFLEWLYDQIRQGARLESLPPHVDLPDAEFAMAGYRRPGPIGG